MLRFGHRQLHLVSTGEDLVRHLARSEITGVGTSEGGLGLQGANERDATNDSKTPHCMV